MAELNQFLQPIGAPVTTSYEVDAYTFGYTNERNAVTGMFIQDASIGSAKIQDASIDSAKIISVEAEKILAGTVTVALNLGTASGGSIVLDGANKRITISDGTTDRVLLGYIGTA